MARAPRKKPTQKKTTDADRLALMCCEQRVQLMQAGRRLHDGVGPLLSASGLKLQLVRMDVPQAAEGVNEAIELLDTAFEQLRSLSQELLASPVYRGGLRSALARLAEQHPEITLTDRSSALVPPEAAAAIYDTVTEAVRVAQEAGARSILIEIAGKTGISLRITDDGRVGGRQNKLALPARLAALARVRVDLATKQGRIVFIRYALRRPARG
jgi:signal transduction histidine kinase